MVSISGEGSLKRIFSPSLSYFLSQVSENTEFLKYYFMLRLFCIPIQRLIITEIWEANLKYMYPPQKRRHLWVQWIILQDTMTPAIFRDTGPSKPQGCSGNPRAVAWVKIWLEDSPFPARETNGLKGCGLDAFHARPSPHLPSAPSALREPRAGRRWDASPPVPSHAPTDFPGSFLEKRQARSFPANSLQPHSSNKRNLAEPCALPIRESQALI